MRRNQWGWLVVLLTLVQVHGQQQRPLFVVGGFEGSDHIKIGMMREEVTKLLGPPSKQQVFGKTELLSYQPDWTVAQASELNPIGIEAGRVTG